MAAVRETRRWLAFGVGLLLLSLLAFALPVAVRLLQGDLALVIDERGLEPDGMFYSDTDEVSEAVDYLRNRALRRASARR